MFQTVPLSIIRSLFTVHSAMIYVIRVCRQLSSRISLVLLESCLQTRMTYTIAEWTVNKLLMIEELSETCRVSCKNKFLKSVHLVGFIIKKFVTMDGHINIKLMRISFITSEWTEKYKGKRQFCHVTSCCVISKFYFI